MRIRRFTTAIVVGGLLAGGVALVGATPASATTFTFNGCDQSNYVLPEGDTLILTYVDCDYTGSTQYSGGTSTVDDSDPTAVSVLVAAGPGFVGLNNNGSGQNALVGACDADVSAWNSEAWTLIDLCSGGAADSASATPAIPAWVQAYGRASKDAACLDGWSPSWQSWAEKVTGGWVCTRNIPSLG